ncbi:MAG: heme-binding domain-containing protein [Phycisphaerales bacterium]|nr:heme-binding domain-containing protein [Phycisphaerales bacterium]MCB9854431.1 heme-binding domain-containing protein [Phycisphaerales bacterium]
MVQSASNPPRSSEVDKRRPRKNRIRWGLGLILIAGAAIQFVPVDKTNPRITSDIPAPPEVKAVLRQSCYDCHSHETTWPWYSRIAPVSWLIANDVNEGREKLNFSTWDRYDAGKQAHKIHEIWEEVEKGEMPLWFYEPLHPEAKLTSEDLAILKAWASATPDVKRGRDHNKDESDDD